MASFNLNHLTNLKNLGFSPSKSGIKNLFLLLRGDLLIPFEGDVMFKDPKGCTRPFSEHYKKYIKPHVIEFEKKRIDSLYALRNRVMVTIPALVIIIAAVIYILLQLGFRHDGHDVVLFIGFIMCCGILAWCYYPVKLYKSSVKSQVFPEVFKFFGDDYKYNENGLLSIESLQNSEIIPDYSSCHTEDYVKGNYKDVPLELTEAKLTKTSGTGKNRRTVTVFQGIMLLCNINKKFIGKTQVKRDAGMLGNWIIGKLSKYDRVHLEDSVFEKQFEVYSSDQIEARYLLTTSFMQRLLDLSALLQSPQIQCSFYDMKLLILLPSEINFFEADSIFKPATFVDDINMVLEQMQIIFDIIDILKLDQNTGL